MRYPRFLASAGLILAAACSDKSGPTEQTMSHPSFATGSGASFTAVYPGGTCQNGPGLVNCNIYSDKGDVALNAGPSGAQLDNGTYFFAVLAPGGQPDPNDGVADLLSTDPYTDRSFTVSGGVLSYSGPHHISGALIQLMPYDDTPNHGGVYILAICQYDPAADPVQPPVTPSSCKYDAFKVNGGGGGTEEGDWDVTVKKYYDANGNGVFDGTDQYLTNWVVEFHLFSPDILLETGLTPATFTYPNGSYRVYEQMPNESGWINSDPGGGVLYKNVTISDAPVDIAFGNYCRFQGVGVRTIGYWKTHQAATTALLPITLYGSVVVSTWTQAYNILNGADSKDANVMLKAQLLGTLLNLKADPTLGTAIVAGSGGKTVNDIIAEAQAFLVAHGSENLTKASANRTTALNLKTLLDGINNSAEGGSTVVINPTPCAYTFGTN